MATRRRTTSKRRSATPAAGNARKAIAVGKAAAAEVLAFRDRALRTRAIAVRASAATSEHPTAALAPRLLRAAGASGRTGVLVAEGDSWFDYPWHDVLRMLEDEHGYDVESVAHKGDRVEDMAYGGGQLEEFTRLLEKLLRRSDVPTAILLSGGGNDVAGEEFGMLLNHARSVAPGLNDDVIRGVIDDRIRNAYTAIIAAITTVCRARIGRALPIVIHGYDHAVPDGRGFAGGWGPFPGPWLEPGFRQKGFSDLEHNATIVAELIDRFNEMLVTVAATPGFEHVRYLDLRGTLRSGAAYKTWWANELHPTTRGFRAVAARFAAAIAGR